MFNNLNHNFVAFIIKFYITLGTPYIIIRSILSTLIILCSCMCFSQTGDFLLNDHSHNLYDVDHSTFDIVKDRYGVLCLANRTGIMDYDGSEWVRYQTPSAALSLSVDSSNRLYVSCINAIGYIERNNHQESFQSIVELDSIDDLFLESHYLQNKVYFIGSRHIIIYDTQNKTTHILKKSLANSFVLGNQVLVNDVDGNTYQINEQLDTYATPTLIAYTSESRNGVQLAIDYQGDIYELKDGEFERMKQSNLLYSLGYDIQEVAWVNDTLIACATLDAGVVFLNRKDTNFIKVSDYQTGLPDNEIYTIQVDHSGGVWAAHSFGLTRILPLFPAKSFGNYTGLHGDPTGCYSMDGELWVTSGLGIFYFTTDTLYENKVYYEVKAVNHQISSKKTVSVSKTDKKSSRKIKRQAKKEARARAKNDRKSSKKKETKRTKKKKRKFSLRRLFQKKKRIQEVETKPIAKKSFFKSLRDRFNEIFNNPNNIPKVTGQLSENKAYVRKVVKIPIREEHKFKKVPDANGKFIDLLKIGNQLLGISNVGIYEIDKQQSIQVIEDKIKKAIAINNQALIISTLDSKIKYFELQRSIWVEKFVLSMDDIIVNLYQTKDETLWLSGSSHIYKVEMTDTSFQIINSYPIKNKFLDDIDILDIKDTIHFVSTNGYYFYDVQTDSLKESQYYRSQIGIPKNHLYDKTLHAIWVYNGETWISISSEGKLNNFQYLGIFPSLRTISYDTITDQLWLLTRSGDILQFNPKDSIHIGHHYPLFVKKVSNKKRLLHNGFFVLRHDENFLTVELSKPDYLGLLNLEFQYKLEGLSDNWSPWTKDKVINFNYLPPGNYKLRTRSQDMYGRQHESKVLSFSVKPPYWHTPWFYLLEIVLFAVILFLSSKMNQSNYKNRLISGAINILTLVLFIEFLQSVISSFFVIQSSPVVDFLIDVVVALLIFPIETYLRYFLSHGKFYYRR